MQKYSQICSSSLASTVYFLSSIISNTSMQKYSQVGISFRNDILSRIDAERGDVSRSRYLLRQLEKVLQTGPISPKINQPVKTQAPNGSESNG